MEHKDFSMRLSSLRAQKGVSARDMSLSIGQSPNYINSIESGTSFPSMNMFFYICEYFGITPADFFNYEIAAPAKHNELLKEIERLDYKEIDSLLLLIKTFKG